jgi:hypothetical protein
LVQLGQVRVEHNLVAVDEVDAVLDQLYRNWELAGGG